MIPSHCNACGRFALDVTGQIERLDSYFLEPGGPPPSSAGDWHRKCLRESAFGAAWYAARLRNFVDVRGYVPVGQTETWTVIAPTGRGDRIALATDGALVELPRASKLLEAAGGTCYREHSAEYNLELPDTTLITAMQSALLRTGECAMSMVFDRLELWPFFDAPDLLGDARFIYDQELAAEWSASWLCAAAEYSVFVPAELVQFCV